MKKHPNILEQNRGLLLQLGLIFSLLIMLAIFNYESSSGEDTTKNYVEINLEIDSLSAVNEKITKPLPSHFRINITEQAKFKGGDKALRKYFADNLNYPKQAKEKDIQGRVYVKFTITEYGKIKNVKVVRSIHKLIDNEAIKLIKNMPDWLPAKANNEQVESEHILPVIFLKL